MKTIQGIIDYCHNNLDQAKLRRSLPKMVNAFNDRSEDVKLHYAYHEDTYDTWKCGWSESDYYPEDFDEDTHDIQKLFKFTFLKGKKKPTANFQRASTYTSECAIFLFKVTPASADIRAMKLTPGWVKDYFYAIKAKKEEDEKIKIWNSTKEEDRNLVVSLEKELNEIFGTPGSYARRRDIEDILSELPDNPYSDNAYRPRWIKQAIDAGSLKVFLKIRKEELVEELNEALSE